MNPKKKRNICPICGNECARYANTYCSSKCFGEYAYQKRIEKWKSGVDSGKYYPYSLAVHIRKYILRKYGNKCAVCGWSEINPHTRKYPLQVHHLDGDWRNSSEENLILLCPNCHSLTETYGARNKGNGRPYRKSMQRS